MNEMVFRRMMISRVKRVCVEIWPSYMNGNGKSLL